MYHNQDVPLETYVKNLQRRNKKLELEVSILQDELDAKKKAIAAFKKWQKKCVRYKIDYWVNEAQEFLGADAPEKKALRRLMDVIRRQKQVNSETKKLADYILAHQDFDEETSREIWSALSSLKKEEGA